MNHAWLYQGKPVSVDMKTPTMLECLPNGKHSLYVQYALDRLSWMPLSLPASVTVSNLPWRIKAIVGANDNQTPMWKVHRQHQSLELPESESLSPFIYMDRSKMPPMTRALTFELSRTETSDFVITDIYAGSKIPPLPWQIFGTDRSDLLGESISYWQLNSFWYSSQLVASKQDYTAPNWATSDHTILI